MQDAAQRNEGQNKDSCLATVWLAFYIPVLLFVELREHIDDPGAITCNR